ncbi:MAG: S8 family serine peptidase [Planctomycetes bacterium]|nr:S8 family serine peptidase [Planctomycetota bacterium]
MRQSLYASSLALAAALTAQQPVDGAAAVTRERWFVTLRTRSFDLEGLRTAIARRDAAAVAAVCADLQQRAVRDQEPLAAATLALGGSVVQHFWLVPAAAVDLPPGAIAVLRGRADVRAVHADGIAEPAAIVRGTDGNNHRAQAVHAQGVLGQGATIAVLDSGFDAAMAGSGRPHRLYFVDGDPANTTGGGLAGSRLLATFALGTQPAEAFDNHGNAVAAVAAGEAWTASPLAGRGHAPRARVVGYGIANDLLGNSSFTVIASAFQRVVQDKLTYNIVCANNSYSGRSDPTDPSQQAMDAAASVADILVTVAAGNEGSNMQNGPSCANGLAVAAVAADSKQLARFSSQGPLAGDPDRTWPDLSACGVDVVMPARDTESATSFYVASGTSFAAPQVCGAAALYRSVRPQATALETKAAILCSTEDVFPPNQWSISSSRHTIGHGFLRDDLLVAAAQGQATIGTGALTAAAPELHIPLAVVQGQTYAAVVAFHRHVLTDTMWSDVDLLVRDPQGRVLAVAGHPRELTEKVVFTAATSGTYDVVAIARRLEIASLPVAVVAMATAPQTTPGGAVTFGQGCIGTGRNAEVDGTAPVDHARRFGNVASNLLVEAQRRNQLLIRGDVMGGPAIVTALAFRLHNVVPPTPRAFWSEVEVRMGLAAHAPANVSGTYANNLGGAQQVVFARRRIDWPLRVATNQEPRAFDLVLPLDTPWSWLDTPGTHVLVEVRIHNGTALGVGEFYPADGFWVQNDPNPAMSLVSGALTATLGGSLAGRGVVLGLVTQPAQGSAPTLRAVSGPVLGRPYRLQLAQAPANALAFLLLGLEDRNWQGQPLPRDLGFLGAPGCTVLTSTNSSELQLCGAAGTSSRSLLLPADPTLLQVSVFHQAAVLDPAANALGVTLSGGIQGVLGNRW